jgi:hypothetical protein
VSAAALFDRVNQRLKRLLADRERMDAWDHPEAPAAHAARPPAQRRQPARLGGDAGIADAARRAGLDPAGGVAPQDRRAARQAAREAVNGRAPGELVAVAAVALLALLGPRPPQTAAQRRAAEALVHELTRMALPWNHDQAAALLPAPQLGRDATAQRLALELAVSATGQAITRAGHAERLLSAMVQGVGAPPPAVSSRRLRAELCVLLPRCPERSAIAVGAFAPAANWTSRRPWTDRLHRELTAGPPLADADIRLLAHLPRAAVAQEPPARWRDRCRELAVAGPAGTRCPAGCSRSPSTRWGRAAGRAWSSTTCACSPGRPGRQWRWAIGRRWRWSTGSAWTWPGWHSGAKSRWSPRARR